MPLLQARRIRLLAAAMLLVALLGPLPMHGEPFAHAQPLTTADPLAAGPDVADLTSTSPQVPEACAPDTDGETVCITPLSSPTPETAIPEPPPEEGLSTYAAPSPEGPTEWCKSVASARGVGVILRDQACMLEKFRLTGYLVSSNGTRTETGHVDYWLATNVLYAGTDGTVPIYFGVYFEPTVGTVPDTPVEIEPQLKNSAPRGLLTPFGKVIIYSLQAQPRGQWAWQSTPSELTTYVRGPGQQATDQIISHHSARWSGSTINGSLVTYVRCDSIMSKTIGCINPVGHAVHMVAQTRNPELYNHILQAHQSGLPGAFLYGSETISTTLTRTTDGPTRDRNRYRACGTSAVPRPGPPNKSCDEYPLASTSQGAATGPARSFPGCGMNDPASTGPTGFSRCFIDANQNSSGGGILQADFRRDRVLDGDAFVVMLMPTKFQSIQGIIR